MAAVSVPVSSIASAATLVFLAAWLGEVVTLNFVIVPNLTGMNDCEKAEFLSRFFPQFFRLATVLALLAIASGLTAILSALVAVPIAAITGGSLVLLLAAFHLVIESRLRPMAKSLTSVPDPRTVKLMTRFLRIVPRVGIVVIVSAFTLVAIGLAEILRGSA